MRGVQAAAKATLECDEGISFLVATGHRGEYQAILKQQSYPYGEWVKAEDWKRLLEIEEPFCFGKIRADLARFDLHPPLFFWLLHVWVLVFGVHVWTGPILNTVISAATIAVVFFLGRQMTRDAVAGGAAALVWALSPTVILASNEARQYDFIGFCTALFAWQVLVCLDTQRPSSWRSVACLGFATAIALLSYFHFLGFVVACCALLVIGFGRKHWRRLIASLSGIVVGVVFFLLAHPGFMESLQRGRGRMDRWQSIDVAHRIPEVRARYAAFVIDTAVYTQRTGRLLEYCILGGAIVLVIAAGVVAMRKWLRLGQGRNRVDRGALAFWCLLVVALTLNVGLYMLGMSPLHAMEPKYPSMVYPLLAVGTVALLWAFGRARRVFAVIIILTMLIASVHSVVVRRAEQRESNDFVAAMRSAGAIVIDNLSVVFLPALAVHIPNETAVFAAEQRFLMGRPQEWRGGLQGDSLFLSWHERELELENVERMLRSVEEEFEISRIAQELVGGRGDAFRLVRKRVSE